MTKQAHRGTHVWNGLPEGGMERTLPKDTWSPVASMGPKVCQCEASADKAAPTGVQVSHPDATIV